MRYEKQELEGYYKGFTQYILTLVFREAVYRHSITVGPHERRDVTAMRIRRAKKVMRSWAAGDRR